MMITEQRGRLCRFVFVSKDDHAPEDLPLRRHSSESDRLRLKGEILQQVTSSPDATRSAAHLSRRRDLRLDSELVSARLKKQRRAVSNGSVSFRRVKGV